MGPGPTASYTGTVRVYLDHAATTPITDAALAAYTAELSKLGNPSSLHASGQAARRRLETARGEIMHAVGASTPSEIILTSGGTEADNLALKGLYWARRAADPRRRRVLVSGIEHHAVMDTAEWLESAQGAEIVWLPVGRDGIVDMDAVDAELADHADEIALMSVIYANNETGAVQPIADLTSRAHAHDIPIHTDAVQAFGHLEVDFARLGVDAMSISAHKIGGPVGIGALVLARSAVPVPVLHGGGQERSVRSGTLDVAGTVAFAAAAQDAVQARAAESERLAGLRDSLTAGIAERIPEAELLGPSDGRTLPGTAQFVFPGCEGDSLLFLLDAAGIDCSTGSACQAGVSRPSHVLLAMGFSEDDARSVLRFSLGRTSTSDDVERLLTVLPEAWTRAKTAGMVSTQGAWRKYSDGGVK
ncbi:cysteine desulfurase family protein [Spelaeicoccus albus]